MIGSDDQFVGSVTVDDVLLCRVEHALLLAGFPVF